MQRDVHAEYAGEGWYSNVSMKCVRMDEYRSNTVVAT